MNDTPQGSLQNMLLQDILNRLGQTATKDDIDKLVTKEAFSTLQGQVNDHARDIKNLKESRFHAPGWFWPVLIVLVTLLGPAVGVLLAKLLSHGSLVQ